MNEEVDLHGKLQVFIDDMWKDCSKVSSLNQHGQICVTYENNQMKVVGVEDLRNKPEQKTVGDLFRQVRNTAFDAQESSEQQAQRFLELCEKNNLIKIIH